MTEDMPAYGLGLLTLVMFPGLVAMCVVLLHRAEAEVHQTFGARYDSYAAAVPAWIPRIGNRSIGRRAAQ